MWFQKVFSMPVRIILTVLGLFLTIGYFSSSDSSRSTQSSSSSGSSQAPDHDTSVTGASGMTVNASENSAKRLKGFSVEEAKEYGRLSAHALSKLARRNSLNALDSLNELKRLRGEREMTAADIERMDFAAPMVPESRSMIAQEAAKTGVPVEVRNAFFDGWEVGVSEVRRGGNP